MRPVITDVDIDCFNREKILESLDHVCARIDRSNGVHEKHPTGVYFQNIPKNANTNVAALDHRVAGEYGYFKIDFLNVNVYGDIKDEDHLNRLLKKEPNWELLEYQEITDQLFHLRGHSKLLKKYKPKSVEDLAMVLAIIRPSKAYLQNCEWEKIKKDVWVKGNEDGYQFKRSHGIAYSLAIIVNLNLFVENLENSI